MKYSYSIVYLDRQARQQKEQTFDLIFKLLKTEKENEETIFIALSAAGNLLYLDSELKQYANAIGFAELVNGQMDAKLEKVKEIASDLLKLLFVLTASQE